MVKATGTRPKIMVSADGRGVVAHAGARIFTRWCRLRQETAAPEVEFAHVWVPEVKVADAFEVPLRFLMDPSHHRRHVFEFMGVQREWFSMPYMDGADERFIWGATAAMLRNFYRFLSA